MNTEAVIFIGDNCTYRLDETEWILRMDRGRGALNFSNEAEFFRFAEAVAKMAKRERARIKQSA